MTQVYLTVDRNGLKVEVATEEGTDFSRISWEALFEYLAPALEAYKEERDIYDDEEEA